MESVDLIKAASLIATAIIIAGAAIGSGLGIGKVAAKFVESAARQPSLAKDLQVKTMIMAAFLDAVPMIAVGIGLLILFTSA
ncbi:F0F1 ATP synthase subunit C [Aliikangiella sp. G2MR2-5]|uniref:F0F1 ATP synthase subunit C n=1 Tax=Aliikangiella sp. G2MR2-5 TaxID=2788943 RepID=UPI0018ABB1F9|nr:F0F1 ATP synthase subunit C [Aliikangiella sp. G2MR2-5]